MAASLTNISVVPCQVIWNATDLGYTDGDLEISLEEMGVEITAHQEGTNVLDMIRTGKKAEITITLKETTLAKITSLIQSGGGASGGLVGWGNSKDFTSMLGDAAKLVLHPIVNDTDNYEDDLCFWKAYPLLNSMVYSGENPRTVAVTFKVFPDLTAADEVRLWSIGDHNGG